MQDQSRPDQTSIVAHPSGPHSITPDTLFALVVNGDLSKLASAQKVEYYRVMCQRVGLDPATQPFKLLTLNGKQTLYCDRGGAAQLCKLHGVSHQITSRARENDLCVVTARAFTRVPVERETESLGAVNVKGLVGDQLANAMMKAETKAKRRATLDLLGLGMLDETETETIPGAAISRPADFVAPPISAIAAPAAIQTSDAPPLSNAGESEESRFRQLRADLNKSLQACVTEKDFRKAQSEFQKRHGKHVWSLLTCHTPNETFDSLRVVHWGRIQNNVKAEDASKAIQEAEKTIVARIEACNNVGDFATIEAEVTGSARLRDDALVTETLMAKGKELDVAGYGGDYDSSYGEEK